MADATGCTCCVTELKGLATGCPHEYLAPLLTDSRGEDTTKPTCDLILSLETRNKLLKECVSKLWLHWVLHRPHSSGRRTHRRELVGDCEPPSRCNRSAELFSENVAMRQQHGGIEVQKCSDEHAGLGTSRSQAQRDTASLKAFQASLRTVALWARQSGRQRSVDVQAFDRRRKPNSL